MEIPVRLSGGASQREGRVEISFRGQWGGICLYEWDVHEAEVVCRQLGFHNGTSMVVAGAYFKDDDLPAYLTGLKCRGNESKLVDCEGENPLRFGKDYCLSRDVAGVTCRPGEFTSKTSSNIQIANHMK